MCGFSIAKCRTRFVCCIFLGGAHKRHTSWRSVLKSIRILAIKDYENT